MANTTAMMMMRSTGVLVGLGLGLSLGCLTVRPNPDHCANLEGDRTCADRYPGERVYCAACGATPEDGCVAERPVEDACYSPCGDGTRFDDDVTCLAGTSSSSGEESTSTGEETGTDTETESSESSTTGPMPCVDDGDCPDAAAPFCEPVSGECVACDAFGAEADAVCAGLDPMAPLCVNGACVACTPENPVVCDDQLLLCDGGTNSCVPCTEHGQCGSGACELAMGRCFPDDLVVHVDGDPTAMPVPDYTSITAAVAAIDDGMHGVIVVHELDMEDDYGAVIINNGKTVALLAAPGETPRIRGTGSNPDLRVEGAGTILYMDGLSLRSGDALGLEVTGAFAWVDRSRIVGNNGGGIVAQNAADLTLRNCFVGGADGSSALRVENASSTVSYSTLGGGTINATGLACVAPDAVDVRNSIIVALGNDGTAGVDVDCPSGTITFTATEAPFTGEGNSAVGELPLLSPEDWFVGYGAGNFHLQDQGLNLFDGVAEWRSGDPATDIDGASRPTVDGTADYAGADVP